MKINVTIILISLTLVPLNANASIDNETNNLFWAGVNNSSYDYLANKDSKLITNGKNFAYSYLFSEQWSASLSYSTENADGQWLENEILNDEVFNSAETSSVATGLSVNWQALDYSVTFSYADIKNDDFSRTFLPRKTQTIRNKDKITSLSYYKFIGLDSWMLGIGGGIQYTKNDTNSLTQRTTEVITITSLQFEQNSWSGYIDFDISYFVEQESFSWTPQLLLSWSEALSGSTEGFPIRTRNGTNNLSSSHYIAPDSGYWELAVEFDWHNNWSTNISYSETISSDIAVDSISLDMSFSF